MSNNSILPYVGGKTRMSDWIVDHFPEHELYIEPFGGSASVLLNKDRSHIEVYNDFDGNLVQFFTTLRDRGDELQEWLQDTPYSRELYKEATQRLIADEVPSDPIARAGEFFLVSTASMQAAIYDDNGFKSSKTSARARTYANKVADLEEYSQRFRGVTIENRDYRKLVEKYDSEDALWYADPPYVKEGEDAYKHGGFAHNEFMRTMADCDGYVIISYKDLPEATAEDDWHIVEKEVHYSTSGRKEPERLIMNFDPAETPGWETTRTVSGDDTSKTELTKWTSVGDA